MANGDKLCNISPLSFSDYCYCEPSGSLWSPHAGKGGDGLVLIEFDTTIVETSTPSRTL
mgnify:CR=1 FL=1